MTDEDLDRIEYLPHVGLAYLYQWGRAVLLQADRVLHPGAGMGAQTEVYLFVLALRQVLRAAYMIRDTLDGPAARRAAAAVAGFEAAVPDTKNARDVLDHFDDYERGVGDLAHPGVHREKRVPSRQAARQYVMFHEQGGPGRYVWRSGDLRIDVAEARDAAAKLADELDSAVYEATDDDSSAR